MIQHPAVSNDEILVNAGQTREFFGNVSTMWIHRRLRDVDSTFPKPIMLAGRNYWRLGDLRKYRDTPQVNKYKLRKLIPPWAKNAPVTA